MNLRKYPKRLLQFAYCIVFVAIYKKPAVPACQADDGKKTAPARARRPPTQRELAPLLAVRLVRRTDVGGGGTNDDGARKPFISWYKRERRKEGVKIEDAPWEQLEATRRGLTR